MRRGRSSKYLIRASRVQTHLNPPYKSGGEADRGPVISRKPVVAGCDAPEVLQPVERTLDAPAQLVETLAEAERSSSSSRNSAYKRATKRAGTASPCRTQAARSAGMLWRSSACPAARSATGTAAAACTDRPAPQRRCRRPTTRARGGEAEFGPNSSWL